LLLSVRFEPVTSCVRGGNQTKHPRTQEVTGSNPTERSKNFCVLSSSSYSKYLVLKMFSIEEGEAIENTIQHKWSTFCRLLFVVKFEIGGGRYRPRSSSNSSRGRGRRRTITNDENKIKMRIDLELLFPA